MISNKQKQEYVDKMLKEFCINVKFRDALEWLIEEMDIVYNDLLEDIVKKLDTLQRWDEIKSKGESS